jgi:glycosyltransferase involved in cell wall biosynthesis
MLVTLSYPYSIAAEQSFIENELLGFEKWSATSPETQMTISPGLSDIQFSEPVIENVVIDHTLIQVRTAHQLQKNTRFIVQIFCTIPHFFIERMKNKSVRFSMDCRRLLKWCDEYATAKTAIKLGWLDELSSKDIVYTWWLTGYTYAIAKSLEGKPDRPKVITRAHGGDLFAIRGVQFRQAKTISLCDKVFPSTLRGKDELDALRPHSGKIVVSRLGVSICHKSKMTAEVFDQRYGFRNPLDTLQVVTISGIDPVKDLARFSQFLNVISDQHSPVTWHHFGEPVNQLAEIANQNQLSRRLKIRSFGSVRNSEIHEILRNYSQDGKTIMINFSVSEGTALSLVEAVANGVPVVGRNIGGVNEIVNNQTGKLISENPTMPELHQAIVDVLARRTELVNSCKEYWSKNYDAYRIYSDFYSDLQELAHT